MPTPNLIYVDGLQSLVEASVYCFNNGAVYTFFTGDPSESAVFTEQRDSDNRLIGSVTMNDARKGTLNCSYDMASDDMPLAAKQMHPSYIVSFRGRFYVVSGEVKTTVAKGDVIKFALPVTELQNPFLPELLSLAGQQLFADIAAATPVTLQVEASNIRPGAAVSYSVESWEFPGTPAPAGIAINPASGLLTINVAAGTYDVRVIAEDDIGDGKPISGQGRYTPTAA